MFDGIFVKWSLKIFPSCFLFFFLYFRVFSAQTGLFFFLIFVKFLLFNVKFTYTFYNKKDGKHIPVRIISYYFFASSAMAAAVSSMDFIRFSTGICSFG